jgi:hypothetical protein
MRLVWVLVLALVGSVGLMAAEATPTAAPDFMEKFQPGKEHEALKKLVGSYDVAVKMWMEPGKDPQESKATAEFTMEMNGRYLKQTFKGTMMGQAFTGVGYDGYDRVANKYVSTWIDDMSTQMMQMSGSSKDGGKTIEFTGDMICPLNNQPIKTRTVHKTVDDDTFTFEMYQTMDGKEVKGMELTYKRKK